MKIAPLISSALALLLIGPRIAQAQLVNGNFETGNLSGWTIFTVPNGGLGLPTVVQFDTAHTGTTSLSARFEPGQTNGIVTGDQYGGGILQNVTLGAGQLAISLNVAAAGPFPNGDGGDVSLLLDGTLLAIRQFGSIAPSQTQWTTLVGGTGVTAGVHEIKILMTRGSFTQIGETPYQYLDNITLSGTAVPEPSAALLLPLGLAGLAGMTRRKLAARMPPKPAGRMPALR